MKCEISDVPPSISTITISIKHSIHSTWSVNYIIVIPSVHTGLNSIAIHALVGGKGSAMSVHCCECFSIKTKKAKKNNFDFFWSMTALKNRIPIRLLLRKCQANASDDGRQIQKFDSNVCGLIISSVTLSWFIEMTQHNRLIRASQQSRYNISTDD